MINITFTARGNPFDGLDKFIKRLERPGNADVRKVADAIAQGFQDNFSAEGNVSGKWVKLARFTVMKRRAGGFAGEHPILVQTGAMRSSYVQRGAKDHVETFATDANGWHLAVGSSAELSLVHEYGMEGPPRIPPRPVTPLTDAARARIGAVVAFVIEQAEKATLGRLP